MTLAVCGLFGVSVNDAKRLDSSTSDVQKQIADSWEIAVLELTTLIEQTDTIKVMWDISIPSTSKHSLHNTYNNTTQCLQSAHSSI